MAGSVYPWSTPPLFRAATDLFMILDNGKILTSDEILDCFEAIGMPLPINLGDPVQREELNRRLSQREDATTVKTSNQNLEG